MKDDFKKSARPHRSWVERVEYYAARGRKEQALKLLGHIVETDLPLFASIPEFQEDKRIAWLYRINLLRDWGYLYEALAWTCLECEMNPSNVTSQAMKERLKRSLNFSVKKGNFDDKDSPNPPQKDTMWSGIAGMREIKIMLERDVILPFQEPELYQKYKVNLPNGILFYGPPGCGKTFIARKLAEIIKFHFMDIKPSDLASIYVHGGQEKIGALFKEAREKAPTLIFFDELDALVPNRGENSLGHHYAAEVNEFLVQLNESWKSKVLVIGATNILSKVDPAVRRPGRMDKKVFIGPPDLEAKIELLKLYMQDRPQEKINWLKIAGACPFYTAAEIENVVNEAARIALFERRPILEDDILKALMDNQPSLKADDIEWMKNPEA